MATAYQKRKRNVFITVVLGTVVIIAIVLIFWVLPDREKPYEPGEEIEGLTSGLARSIPQDYPRVVFSDQTSDAGIYFNHFQGKRTTQLPEDMGSGAAWGDYNNDGFPDLFIANFVGPIDMTQEEIANSEVTSVLYKNNGDGTFKDVSSAAGLDLKLWAMGAAWGDYNNDGWDDLFVTSYGANHLYHNNGNDTFTDICEKSRIGDYEGFWSGISWADYNKDGNLDIYVCGYVEYSQPESHNVSLQYNAEVPTSINPSSFPPSRNLLFKNDGNGRFDEVADEAGVLDEMGRSLSASWCDFNNDGFPDLYVANDVSDNVMFQNMADGTFNEISHSALVADYRGAMGIGTGDWDNDEDMDMFVTHWIAQENALYSSLQAQVGAVDDGGLPVIRFMDEADRYGLGQIALDFVGFGTSFLDYDNDGRLDIFVANGSTFQVAEDPSQLIPMCDQLFWNKSNKEGFFEVSGVSGEIFDTEYVSRGTAVADYDNDGDLDIFVTNNIGPGVLLRNDGGSDKNWVKVKASSVLNRPVVGTRIRIVTGNMVQIRQAGSQSSYLSQNDIVQHFGLSEANSIDTLLVTWPSNESSLFTNIQVNQTLLIKEGDKDFSIIQ